MDVYFDFGGAGYHRQLDYQFIDSEVFGAGQDEGRALEVGLIQDIQKGENDIG